MTLRDAWEAEARNWAAWARKSGHDSYWRFHRDAFLGGLPPAPRTVLDVGCGEGRLPRDLKARGYDVAGLDGSATLVDLAREADPTGTYILGDAASLPFGDGSFELVTAFMSIQDLDDPGAALREIHRVLVPGGAVRAAVVHPINSAGAFEPKEGAPPQPARNTREPDAAFVIRESYAEERIYVDRIQRDGLPMTFTSLHRPLEGLAASFLEAGFVIDHVAEVYDTGAPHASRWQRISLFLHLGGSKLGARGLDGP